MSKGTTCAAALKAFEEKEGTPAAECEAVKLMAFSPPIEKLDSSLNALVACKHLSLSTNCIEKMINLPGLKNLQILSMGRNQIKKISGLEEVGQTLRELWLSYNLIDKMDGLQPCVKLQVLFMSNNKIKSWDEVEKLAALPEMQNVLLSGNPIYDGISKEDAKPLVLKRVPNLKTIDGEMVTEELREKALKDE